MKRYLAFVALPFCLIQTGQVMGQETDRRFYHLSINEGLSQSTVQAILQDSEGYMWFGTQDGLNRYNGYDITIYRVDTGDTNSISDNDIRVLYEDKNGVLWIGTQARGLNRYDRDRDRFIRYVGEPDDWQTISANTVWAILEDSENRFWVGTAHGLNIMDREEGTFRRIFHDPRDKETLSNNQITTIYEDTGGTIWIGTASGFNRYHRESDTFTRFTHYSGESETRLGTVRVIYEDRMNHFWIGTENDGLFLFDRDTEEFTRFVHDSEDPASISDNHIFDILEDSTGELWIGTGNEGLNRFDRETGVFHRYYHQPDNPYSISNDGINYLYESRDNILWVGTFAGGVSYHELRPTPFITFKNDPQNPNSLNNNVVQALLEGSNENIWVGTDGGGLNRFDPATEKFQHYTHRPNSPGGLSSDVVLDIHETEKGLWLATYGGGVDLFDPDTETVQNFSTRSVEDPKLASDYVFTIHETSDSLLWFGTNWGGVSIFDPQTERVIQNLRQPDPSGEEAEVSITNNDVRPVYEDSSGEIWIGVYGGVVDRYNRNENRITSYNINEKSSYYGSVAQDIHEDTQNRLWFATRGAGLMEFDRAQDLFVPRLTTTEGLPSNVVHSIEEDAKGNLWLSTNNGIVRYTPDGGNLSIYGTEHGIAGREFNPGSSMQDRNGFIYFGGVSGFTRFHPDSVRMNTETHTTVLTELLLFNEPVKPGEESPLENHISRTDKIVLPYNSSVITLEYAALNFSSMKGNDFAYRLEGFDENWNRVGNQRRATYTNLSPGDYTFQVRTANRDGVWGEPSDPLTIVITPPFWRTSWFIWSVFILLVFAISAVYNIRVRHIRKRAVELENMVRHRTVELQKSNETKNKLFSVVAHDLRNLASGIVGWAILLKESVDHDRREEVKEYSGYLYQSSTQFSNFLKNFLDWARSQTKSIQHNPKHFSLEEIIQDVIEQEEPKALSKNIRIRQDSEPDLFAFADPDMISVVLRNLVNNALKFTEEGGLIEIVTHRAGDSDVQISVCDNGIGMDDETKEKLLATEEYVTKPGTSGEKGTGLGFRLCKSFVENNKGTLSIESEKGKGTSVHITLPSAKSETYSYADE